jgi:hypothetical protein
LPRDGGPTRQELSFNASVMGGYDDNVTAGLGTGSTVAPTAMISGTTASLSGTLGYFEGNTRHSIQMGTTGSLSAYPDNLDHPAPAGAGNVGVRTTVGRDLTIAASEQVFYQPLYNFYSPGASSAPQPPGISEAAPATGLFARESWISNSSVSLDRRWSGQDSTSLSYFYRTQQFIDDNYGDIRGQNVRAGYRRRLARGVRARADYEYKNTEYADTLGSTRPLIEHTIEGGPEIEKVLSRTRSLRFSLAAGASRIESIRSSDRQPYQAWLPTGSVTASFALSPTSSVDGVYRRDASTLYGATDDVYSTDTATVSAGWRMTDHVGMRVGATYGNWKTLVASGATDTLNIYGGFLQVQVPLTDRVAAAAGYYYYYHRYSNPGALPAGFPAEYDRNAVRVGLQVWVPLKGSPQRPQR